MRNTFALQNVGEVDTGSGGLGYAYAKKRMYCILHLVPSCERALRCDTSARQSLGRFSWLRLRQERDVLYLPFSGVHGFVEREPAKESAGQRLRQHAHRAVAHKQHRSVWVRV